MLRLDPDKGTHLQYDKLSSYSLCKHLALKTMKLCIDQENYNKVHNWKGYQAITQFHSYIAETEKHIKLVNRSPDWAVSRLLNTVNINVI